MDRNLENRIPVWQDDMILVTRGTMEDHYKEVVEISENLQQKGYRASFEKLEIFDNGFRIDERGITPRVSRTKAIANIKPPKTVKKSDIFWDQFHI